MLPQRQQQLLAAAARATLAALCIGVTWPFGRVVAGYQACATGCPPGHGMWLSALRPPAQPCGVSAKQLEVVLHQGRETLPVQFAALLLAEQLHVLLGRRPAMAATAPQNLTCAALVRPSVPFAAMVEKTLNACRRAPKKAVALPCETGAVDLLDEQLSPRWRTMSDAQQQPPRDRLQEAPSASAPHHQP